MTDKEALSTLCVTVVGVTAIAMGYPGLAIATIIILFLIL